MFGLRSAVLEGKVREPDEVLAGIEAVTLEDVQRVAQDIIRQERLNLAVIGPFDDSARFEPLLDLSAN
jgi:predicted Zn-dependent peptidase